MAWSGRTAHETNSITEGIIWKQLLIFFFPILLGTFFQQLYNTADAIIVGKYVGKEALAAVGGATGVLINLLVGFFTGLSSGATVLISQYFGARRDRDVGETVHTAIALSLLGGVVITVLGEVFAPAVLRLMGTPEDIMGHALTYIRIYFGGVVFSLIYNIGSGILRAIGDSRRPLFFLIAACMTNIVLDVILVTGFDMGVGGAAVATLFSQGVSAVLVVVTLCRSPFSYQLFPKKVRLHPHQLSGILRIGFPAGIQSVMYSLSNVIIQSSVNGFGTDTVAAWTAFGKLDGLFWMTVSAFGVSVTTFAGQNFGARRYDRMKRSVWTCLGMAAATTFVLAGVLMGFGRYVLHAFADDPKVIEIGLEILFFLAPTWCLYLCIEIFSGALRGAGDAFIPTMFTLFGVCLMRVVWLCFVAPQFNSLKMVLTSYPLTWCLTSVLFVAYYLRGRWLRRCMKKAGHEIA
ncbi:MAG: MATE family efflux transporter [Clostridia bacterium]|nr:MATE family efflux transporter [Clostridia bacterium]